MAPLVWVTRATNTVSVEVTNSETIQRGAIRPPLKLLLLVACISGMSIIFQQTVPKRKSNATRFGWNRSEGACFGPGRASRKGSLFFALECPLHVGFLVGRK